MRTNGAVEAGEELKGKDRKGEKGQTKLFPNYFDVLTMFNFINVSAIYLYIVTGCAVRLQRECFHIC